MFEEYTKIFNRNILELVKAADYFDIQSMTDSLVVYIAKELMAKSNQDIYATLYGCIFYVPHKFKRNVLCVMLTNSMHHNNLHYKHELNGIIANGTSFVKKCLNKKHFSQNLDINDFTFLSKIKGNFIQYEETKEFGSFLKHHIAYPNLKLDFSNKYKFRLYIDHYLDPIDRHGTMIAGGIFSCYQSQSLFAQNMPDLFELMKNNQDIDIFVHDNGKQEKFINYYEKIYEVYLQNALHKQFKMNSLEHESIENYKIYQGVNAFKIRLLNGDKLNFIFVDKEEYPSIFSFLETFDFSVSKIFYSYNSNNIFLPLGIFSEFKRINVKFQVLDLFHDVYSDIESLIRTEFVKYVNALEKLCSFYIDMDQRTNMTYINDRKIEFILKYRNCLRMLCKCSKMFYRIVKYGFKSYFKNFDEASFCYKNVNYVYSILKTQIDNNCFTFENITDSVFNYILKKNMLKKIQ